MWSIAGCANSDLILSEQVLVFAQNNHDICGASELRGIDPLSGVSLWAVPDDHGPAAADSSSGRIIAESPGDTEAIDPRTGHVVWLAGGADATPVGGSPTAVGDGVVYIGCASASV